MKHFGKSHPRWILHVLMILCAVGILYSAFILFKDGYEYAKGDAAYQQLRLIGESSEPSTDQESERLQNAEETSSEKKGEYINGVDFTSLEKINPDVTGWIFAEGTEIDYPVLKGKDNDYYLHHLFTGDRNKLGSIFMDYRNQGDFSDRNTMIYGHNMKDGSMFSSLTKYKNQQYYDSFPNMVLYTPAGDYTIELFAGFIAEGNYEYVRFDFKDDHNFESYIDSLMKKSTFETNTIIKPNDRIVTLTTCTYEFDDARYILFGALKPKGDN